MVRFSPGFSPVDMFKSSAVQWRFDATLRKVSDKWDQPCICYAHLPHVNFNVLIPERCCVVNSAVLLRYVAFVVQNGKLNDMIDIVETAWRSPHSDCHKMCGSVLPQSGCD